MARFLLLPIEVANRELTSKINIAKKSLDFNLIPIIGPKDVIQKLSYNLKSSKGFLDKGFDSRSSIQLYKRIKNSGGYIFSLDEEGAVDVPIANFLDKRYSKSLFNYANTIFFWGSNQYERFKFRSKSDSQLVVTGNPRFVKREKIDIKKNNQITIITNCGWANNISGINWIRKNYGSRSKYLEERIHNDKVKIKNFIKLIKYLSKKNNNIVLRPHHEENVYFWKNLFKKNNIKNIEIDNQSNIKNILEKSACIFHCDSSVAIDASIIGIPVISITSSDLKKDYLAKIAFDMSTEIYIDKIEEFKTLDLIINYVKKQKNNNNKQLLYQFFNISNNQEDPVELICKSINKIQLENNKKYILLIYDIFVILFIQVFKTFKNIFIKNNSDAEKVYSHKHKFFWNKFPIFSFVDRLKDKRSSVMFRVGKCLIMINVFDKT